MVEDLQTDWYDSSFLSCLGCRVLVVGAGGIGCELLKNLVLTGFTNIDIIDLDTIDVSNLNRQFLFRREHVGKPKVEVAVDAVKAVAPEAKVLAHHDSVLSSKYDVDFFQQFTVVLSALDNREARIHVNRLCLAARVPLIESGSSGYLGQVNVIVRDQTECYECLPKSEQKSYPGCTIRNTPSEPIHCIVWAKHLFNQLFGQPDAEDEVSPDMNDEENKYHFAAEETVESGLENRNYQANGDHYFATDNSYALCTSESTRQWAENNNFDPVLLFTKFFHDDILYLLSMSNLWRERRKPTPLIWDSLPDQNPSASRSKSANDLWTVLDCRQQFEDALNILGKRVRDGSVLVWDKDDDAALRFVTACANIRAHAFHIPMKSLFDIKSMAGNIIPAIATTNAIVAGMIVIEALKVVFDRLPALRNIFITRLPNPRGKVLVDQVPNKPNPNCYVCSNRREIVLKTNVNLTTVNALEIKFLKTVLHMVAPDVIISGTGVLVISSEQGETNAVGELTLENVGIINGCVLECDDFLQKLELRIRIVESNQLKSDEFDIVNDSAQMDQESEEKAVKRASNLYAEDLLAKRVRNTIGDQN